MKEVKHSQSHSIVGIFALGLSVVIVEPVDVVDELVGLCTEADRFDVQVSEARVVGIDAEVLRLDSHEFGVEPCAEHLAVEGLPPLHVMVIVCILKWHSGDIGLDLTNIEEHVVDLLVGVCMRTAQVVAFANSFLHLEAVVNGKRDVIVENRLHFALHALDLPEHPIEHLHVHAPLGGDVDIWIQTLHDVSWSDNGHIGANGFYLLLTDPLSTQAPALRIGVSSSSRYVDEALDIWRVLYGFGDGHGHADVCFLELLILFVEDMRADAGDGNVRALKCESDLFFISHVLEFEIGLIAEIRRRLDFLEPVIPDSGHLAVRENDL